MRDDEHAWIGGVCWGCGKKRDVGSLYASDRAKTAIEALENYCSLYLVRDRFFYYEVPLNSEAYRGHVDRAVAAAEVIEQARSVEGAEVLIRALQCEHDRIAGNTIQIGAAKALAKIGDFRALGPLATLTATWKRCDANEFLGPLKELAARRPIDAINELAKSSHDGVRHLALDMAEPDRLTLLGVSEAVRSLSLVPDDDLREKAARILWRFPEEIHRLIVETSEYDEQDAKWGCLRLSEEAAADVRKRIDALLATCYLPDTSRAIDAINQLAEMGSLAILPIISLFASRYQFHTNDKAVSALCQIGEPALGPLSFAAAHGPEEVREYSAKALGLIGDARAVEPLIAALVYKKGKDPDRCWVVRKSAAQALGMVRDGRVIDPLISALEDVSEYVRDAAFTALNSIADMIAIETYKTAVHNSGENTCYWATQSLATQSAERLRGEQAIEPLLEALGRWSNHHDRIHRSARAALNVLGVLDNDDPRIAKPLTDRLSGLRKHRVWNRRAELEFVDNLRHCLQRRISEIPENVLLEVADLDDVEYEFKSNETEERNIFSTDRLDCEEFRQLARTELSRRGFRQRGSGRFVPDGTPSTVVK